MGLAEESPHLPLKVLHKELEAEPLTTLTTQLKQVGNQWGWGLRRILKDILPIKTGLKLLTSPESPDATAKRTHATVWG